MSRGNTNGPLHFHEPDQVSPTVPRLKRWTENAVVGVGLIVTVVMAGLIIVSAVLVFTAAGRLLVSWAHTAHK